MKKLVSIFILFVTIAVIGTACGSKKKTLGCPGMISKTTSHNTQAKS